MSKKELLCLLCLICLTDCFGKLITTGGILETTLDPLDLGFDTALRLPLQPPVKDTLLITSPSMSKWISEEQVPLVLYI